MRLQSGYVGQPPQVERREVERSDRVVEVMAPTTWTDARVESWLDWAGGEIDPTRRSAAAPRATPNVWPRRARQEACSRTPPTQALSATRC
jgi:hypothetical protein